MYVCHSALVIICCLKNYPQAKWLKQSFHFIKLLWVNNLVWAQLSFSFVGISWGYFCDCSMLATQLQCCRPKKTQFCMVSSSRKLAQASSYDSTRIREKSYEVLVAWPWESYNITFIDFIDVTKSKRPPRSKRWRNTYRLWKTEVTHT